MTASEIQTKLKSMAASADAFFICGDMPVTVRKAGDKFIVVGSGEFTLADLTANLIDHRAEYKGIWAAQ